MKVLVFDTETTGLPIGKNPSIYNTHLWPYIIQFSFILYDTDKKEMLNCGDYYIKTDAKVSEGSMKIHGITEKMYKRNGHPITDILHIFNKVLESCDIVLGHNLSFDKRLIIVEGIRNNIKMKFTNNKYEKKREYCTMKKGTNICKIEYQNKNINDISLNSNISLHTNTITYKYPKLSELYFTLFHSEPSGLHNAMSDILICLRCYCKMECDFDILHTRNHKINELFNLYCC